VDNPTQNLESYFLEVWSRPSAKRRRRAAHNPARGGRVFARCGCEGAGHTRILERLTTPQAAPATPTPAAPVETGPAVDEQKLESLTKVEPAPAPGKPSATAKETSVDLSKADEKLSSLLGGKKVVRGRERERRRG